MVDHRRYIDSGSFKLFLILLDLLLRHVEGQVIHRGVGRGDVAAADQVRRVRDTGLAFLGVWKPEESQGIALTDVEEEVLTHPVG